VQLAPVDRRELEQIRPHERRGDQHVGINHEAQCKHQRFFLSDLTVWMT